MGITVPEDQYKFIIPLNRDTEQLYYDQRLILDNMIKSEPRSWRISKVNRLGSNGLSIITCAQDKFQPSDDAIEFYEYDEESRTYGYRYYHLDDIGNYSRLDKLNPIGWWAEYFSNFNCEIPERPPIIETPDKEHAEIVFSGTDPEIKVGGSYKKFTVKFYDELQQESPFKDGEWKFEIRGETDLSDKINVLYPQDGQIKVKFIGNESFIGKILTVSYASNDGILAVVKVKIIGL